MNNYFNEKSKFYYDLYLKGKRVQKVCAFIKDEDKFLVIVKNGKATNVGGSVDVNEKAKDAVIREIFEETGAIVEKVKYISKHYYSVNWKYNDKEFPNNRVEYYYLCKLKNKIIKPIGLEGEFDKGIKLEWHTIKELEDLQLNSKELMIMKNV